MRTTIFASLFVFAATSAFAADAPSMTGQWAVHASISGNESDRVCTFTQTGKDLAGSCTTADKAAQLTGTLDGNKLTWKYDADYNGTTITLTYTATLDDSGKIAGTVEVEPYGVSGDFTAIPAKPADPAAK